MIRRGAIILGLLALILAGGAALRASLTPAALPAAAPDPTLAARGEYLARAGDCVACHSAPGGAAFAGGLKMGTPLGNIYTTNITPDPQTGIGTYSLRDFDLALRHGIAKGVGRLYPAMPFPSYAKLSNADVRALYAFFMTRVPPVHQVNQRNNLPLLLRQRWLMAGWDLFFAPPAGFKPSPVHDAQWNRGAYLVEGLGHCGACHTPRGLAWQEAALTSASPAYLSGAALDGWRALSLRGDPRTGLGTWSEQDIIDFLKTGQNRWSSVYGSMTDVINNSTPYLSDKDLQAIAVYLKSLSATLRETPYSYSNATSAALGSDSNKPGAALYAGFCRSCHGASGKASPPFMPPLAGNQTVLDQSPDSLINLVLNGSAPLVVKGTPAAYRMPQFRAQLDDTQIAAVLNFIRTGWGNNAPLVTAADVATLRRATNPASIDVIIQKMR